MASKNARKCAYNKCMLPKDNNKYWIQLLCLGVSICFMAIDVSAFTFLSVFMYVVPITLDLVYSEFENRLLTVVRVAFLAANAIVVVFCIVGQFGFLVDGGDVISVIDTSMIFAQKTINKTSLLYFLIADLMVPVIMVFGTPNQRSAEAILFTLERRSA